MHINNIFVVENNTVQVYIEQESYLFYCIGAWEKLEHNQQVKHLEINSEAMKKTHSAAAEDGCTRSFHLLRIYQPSSFEGCQTFTQNLSRKYTVVQVQHTPSHNHCCLRGRLPPVLGYCMKVGIVLHKNSSSQGAHNFMTFECQRTLSFKDNMWLGQMAHQHQ